MKKYTAEEVTGILRACRTIKELRHSMYLLTMFPECFDLGECKADYKKISDTYNEMWKMLPY